MEVSGLLPHLIRIDPTPASREAILRFHTAQYLEKLERLSENEGGEAGDCAPFSHGALDIALLSAGGVINAVDAVLDGKVDNAYCLVRPPGHHAERDRGRGFCLLGNVAIAALHALETKGVQKICIIDWDVHHGNGTQQAFYSDDRVMFVSIHQDRNYPLDSGHASELGEGRGLGYNLNIALPPGCGHGAYIEAMKAACRVAMAHQPDLIMVGGYSESYAPFCGLAVVEALSGHTSKATDPWLEEFKLVGQQEAQVHQVATIVSALDKLAQVRPDPDHFAAQLRVCYQ